MVSESPEVRQLQSLRVSRAASPRYDAEAGWHRDKEYRPCSLSCMTPTVGFFVSADIAGLEDKP